MIPRFFVLGILASLAGCGSQPGSKAKAPAELPWREGRVFKTQLAKEMPPKGQIRLVYLGAIRIQEHARFTWRVFAHEGHGVFMNSETGPSNGGPVIHDLQLTLQRDKDGQVWFNQMFEPVKVVDESGKAVTSAVAKAQNWGPQGKFDPATPLDSLVTLKQTGAIVKNIPVEEMVLAEIKSPKPGEPGLPVRFRFQLEP